VVPKPAEGQKGGLFDFGGGYIGEDEEDEGPAKRGGGSSEDGEGGQKTSGYLAMGSGMSGFGSGGGVGGYSDGGEAELPDRSRELVQATVDLLSIEVDTLAQKLVPRLEQYLQAFTQAKYGVSGVGPRGEITLLEEGKEALYRDLEGEDLDLVDASLRFTLAEFVLRRYRIPLLVDDPFTDLDPKRRKLLAQMLGYFARATQVVVFSQNEDIPGHALELEG